MSDRELLRECLNALNQIKNTKYNGEFKDTYQLAGTIDRQLQKLSDFDSPIDPFSSKMFKQLKINYNDKATS